MAVLAVAVGNSRIQVGRLEAGRVERVVRVAKEAWTEACDLVLSLAGVSQPEGIVLAGVNPPLEARLAAAIESRLPGPLIRVDAAGGAGLVNRCLPPERVGVDRLLAARAGLERTERPTLVIDLGTAATFNLVTPPGVFHGGLIAAGLGLSASALAAGTAALPAVSPGEVLPDLVGRSTEAAIAGGTFWVLAGGVERIVAGLAERLGTRPAVLATGGDAERIAAATAAIDEVVPDLVLEGLWHVWRDGPGR